MLGWMVLCTAQECSFNIGGGNGSKFVKIGKSSKNKIYSVSVCSFVLPSVFVMISDSRIWHWFHLILSIAFTKCTRSFAVLIWDKLSAEDCSLVYTCQNWTRYFSPINHNYRVIDKPSQISSNPYCLTSVWNSARPLARYRVKNGEDG